MQRMHICWHLEDIEILARIVANLFWLSSPSPHFESDSDSISYIQLLFFSFLRICQLRIFIMLLDAEHEAQEILKYLISFVLFTDRIKWSLKVKQIISIIYWKYWKIDATSWFYNKIVYHTLKVSFKNKIDICIIRETG